jgi:hypothetical protein
MVHEPSTAMCMYWRISRFEAAYSPKCVEDEFCELRHNGVLGSSSIRCSPKLALGLAWWHHAFGGKETRFS